MLALSDVNPSTTATPKVTLTPGLGKFWEMMGGRVVRESQPKESAGLVFVRLSFKD